MVFSNTKNILAKFGESVMDFVIENYPKGNIILGIDPDIWNECAENACLKTNDIKLALRERQAHFLILRNPIESQPLENQYVALALAASQIQLYYEADEKAFNDKMCRLIGVDNIQEDYYRMKWSRYSDEYLGFKLQELIFYNTQYLLKKNGYITTFPAEPRIGAPGCYVKFPGSQSFSSIFTYGKSFYINRFSGIWVNKNWAPEDSLYNDFKDQFFNEMKNEAKSECISCKHRDAATNLLLGFLYRYFSQVWDGTSSEYGYRTQASNHQSKVEIKFNISTDVDKFELYIDENKCDTIPQSILYTRLKTNSIFLLDERYENYAYLERGPLDPKKIGDNKGLILLSRDTLYNLPPLPPNVRSLIINDKSLRSNQQSSYFLLFIDQITENVIKFFNLKTGSPLFEFIGGISIKRNARYSKWYDFAIPKLRINFPKVKLFIDGELIEASNNDVDLSKLTRDTTHIIYLQGIQRIRLKIEIVSNAHYPKGEMPKYSGWIIKNRIVTLIQNKPPKKVCCIIGLRGENVNEESYPPLAHHLQRFEFIKSKIDNNLIEKRKKYVC